MTKRLQPWHKSRIWDTVTIQISPNYWAIQKPPIRFVLRQTQFDKKRPNFIAPHFQKTATQWWATNVFFLQPETTNKADFLDPRHIEAFWSVTNKDVKKSFIFRGPSHGLIDQGLRLEQLLGCTGSWFPNQQSIFLPEWQLDGPPLKIMVTKRGILIEHTQ